MRIIGIGTDITECERIAAMHRRHGTHFLNHVYTEFELQYSLAKRRFEEHLTGRWAAKEAVLKALGTGWIAGISWKDVEVRNEVGGRPTIRLSGGALKVAENLGINEVQISISHCKTHAIAYALAVGE